MNKIWKQLIKWSIIFECLVSGHCRIPVLIIRARQKAVDDGIDPRFDTRSIIEHSGNFVEVDKEVSHVSEVVDLVEPNARIQLIQA